jgi:hypothetical protein
MSDFIHRHLRCVFSILVFRKCVSHCCCYYYYYYYYFYFYFYFYFQGLQPSLAETSNLPTFAQPSPQIGQVPYHPAPQFVFTDTDHKPLQYPAVPSVYDPPYKVAEDRVDRRYGNKNHHQHNRHKRL